MDVYLLLMIFGFALIFRLISWVRFNLFGWLIPCFGCVVFLFGLMLVVRFAVCLLGLFVGVVIGSIIVLF